MRYFLELLPRSVIGRLRLVIVVTFVVLAAFASAGGYFAALRMGMWGIVLAVIVAAVIFYLVLPRIVRRLETITRGVIACARGITEGEFSHEVPEIGDDELSELARAVNGLARWTERSIADVENAAQEVASGAQQILAAAEEQQQAANRQSASLHETASTVEELDLSARQASENAQEVVARTERASQEILALSEKVQRVSKVSEVIDEVSRQIRILALNASIEAARADTNGGGFSVIATEIRRLADDTRKSTNEIDALVLDMQEATSSSAMIMEQTVESVKVIGLAMTQQSVATSQISEVMVEMNAGMRQAVESTSSTVEAGEELSRLAGSLQTLIERLRQGGTSAAARTGEPQGAETPSDSPQERETVGEVA